MPHDLSKGEFAFARKVQRLVRGKSVLYHGTRYPKAILESGLLMPAAIGDPKVCFSRAPEEAMFWATLPRDDDEGVGAILTFDRNLLSTRYRLELINDCELADEQEECIWQRDVPLAGALIGFVNVPGLQEFTVPSTEVT